MQELTKFADYRTEYLKRRHFPGVPVERIYCTPETVLPINLPTIRVWFFRDGWIFSAIETLEDQIYKGYGSKMSLFLREVLRCAKEATHLPYISLDALACILENGAILDSRSFDGRSLRHRAPKEHSKNLKVAI